MSIPKPRSWSVAGLNILMHNHFQMRMGVGKCGCWAGLAGLAMLYLETVQARNVIFFIGDGMGYAQVQAARSYAGAPLSFEGLPHQAQCTTYSADSSVTDSAAAGTALATGYKVNNGVLSLALPGDGRELETLLEYFKKKGKRVGLVTTTYVTHATPAAFGAHESARGSTTGVANDYLYQTKPHVLFGGGGYGMTVTASRAVGYDVATNTASFNGLNPAREFLAALFGSNNLPYEAGYLSGGYPYPHLEQVVAKALDALDDDPDGFFLMVEGGEIDHACHSALLPEAVHETLHFSSAVETALRWAAGRSDTLILVTADHETGGLIFLQDNGAGYYPGVAWSTGGHTGANVPVYAWGKKAERVSGLMNNTDMFALCASVDEPIPPAAPGNLRIVAGP